MYVGSSGHVDVSLLKARNSQYTPQVTLVTKEGEISVMNVQRNIRLGEFKIRVVLYSEYINVPLFKIKPKCMIPPPYNQDTKVVPRAVSTNPLKPNSFEERHYRVYCNNRNVKHYNQARKRRGYEG